MSPTVDCPCLTLRKKSLRTVVQRSLLVRAGLGLAAASVVLTGGCSAGQTSSGTKHPPTVAASQSPAPPVEVPSTIEHWGSFFGAKKGTNYDLATSPVAVTVPGTVAQVGTSNSTEYALLTNGSVYAWGLGTQGELGDGGTVNSFATPVRVRFPRGVKIAYLPTDAMPYDTALAVDTKGHAWGWGENGGGEFCLGNRKPHTLPVELPLSHVTALAGASHHAVYDAGGTVYACGQNIDGTLGDGSRSNATRPRKVVGLDGQKVTKLLASFANAGALLSNGEYFDWGYDANGQLGDGHTGRASDVPVRVVLPHPVTQVALGGSIWNNGQTLALLSDGSLWDWGANFNGQLGDGTTQSRASPVHIPLPAGVTYQSLATGSATAYAVSTTGKVYAWGTSFVGQVGNGLTTTVMTPLAIVTGAASISSTANNVAVSIPG
jgi:alpha-tubulin suppressor-like RCC1 family protein